MSYDIGDGYYVDNDGNIKQHDPDTNSYQTDGYDTTNTDNSSSFGFNLKDIGELLKGKSSYGMAGQLAGIAGISGLLNKIMGGGSGGYAGYQGGIPKYTASRTMNPIPTTMANPYGQTVARRPGSGGVNYFSDIKYLTPAEAAAAATPAAPAAPAPVANEDNSYKVFASGGIASLGGYSDGGQLLRGPGDGVSDDIPATIGNRQPARLADGEFVIPARIVSELGNGSTDAGARKLYAMMDRIKATRAKAKNIAANTKAAKHLPA